MLTQTRRSTSAGFSLIEMLIVVSIIGLLSLWALPRAGVIYDRAMVRGARTTITNMYITARNAARTNNKTAVFRRSGNLIWVEANAWAPATSKTTVRQPTDLLAQYGVTISAGDDSIRVDQRGMLGGNSTTYKYRFGRRGITDSVMINGYGRVLR